VVRPNTPSLKDWKEVIADRYDGIGATQESALDPGESQRKRSAEYGQPPTQHSFDRKGVDILQPENKADPVSLGPLLANGLSVERGVGRDDDVWLEARKAIHEHASISPLLRESPNEAVLVEVLA